MSALDVDPANLEYDFRPQWCGFQTSKVHQFLRTYLRKRISEHQRTLESVSAQELGVKQGEIREARLILALIESRTVDDQVREAKAFLEKIEKSYG